MSVSVGESLHTTSPEGVIPPVLTEAPLEVRPTTPERDGLKVLAADIRKNGDVLDRMSWLRRYHTAGATTLATTGIISLQQTLLANTIYPELAAASGGTILLAGVTGFVASHPLANRHQRKAVTSLIDSTHTLTTIFDGEPVEIYRSGKRKNPDLHVLWDGPADRDQTLESEAALHRFRNLKVLAEGTDARTVAVPVRILKDYDEGLTPSEGDTRDDWVKRIKKRAIVDERHGTEHVRDLSLEELDTVIANCEKAHNNEPLHTFMQILRSIKPNHPALKSYFPGVQDTARLPYLERSLRKGLERQLEDTDARRLPIDDWEDGPTHSREKTFRSGFLQVGSDGRARITWRDLQRYTETEQSEMLTHFRAATEHLESIGQYIGVIPPSKLELLCEMGAWLSIQGIITGSIKDDSSLSQVLRQVETVVPTGDAKPLPMGLQERTAHRLLFRDEHGDDISLRNLVGRRVGRTLAGLAVATTLGLGLGLANNQYLYTQLERSNQLFEDGGSEDGSPEARKIDELENAPVFRMTSNVLDLSTQFEYRMQELGARIFSPLDVESYRRPPENALRDRLVEGGQLSGVYGSDARVGNVPTDMNNQPVWELRTIGDMSTEGYWAESVFNQTDFTRLVWHRDAVDLGLDIPQTATDAEYYAAHDAAYQQLRQLPLAGSEAGPSGSRIEVSRSIRLSTNTVTAPGAQDYKGFGYDSGYYIVPIPVLQNTHIAAASIDGQPVKVLQLDSGREVLMVQASNGEHQLEYWLAAGGENPRAFGPVQFSADYEDKDYPEHRFDPLWEEAMGQPLPAGRRARVAAERDHIRSEFEYELAPLDMSHSGLEQVILNTPYRFAGTVLDNQEANCNVANTLLTLSNPGVLNYVEGFNNSNTTEQVANNTMYLSLSERHAWAVDGDAQIQDATPTKGLSADEAEFFSEDFKDPKTPEQERNETLKRYALYIIGVSGVLASAIGRRRLRNLPNDTRRSYAAARLRFVSDENLEIAHDTLNTALYSGGRQIDDAVFQGIVDRRQQQAEHPASIESFDAMFAHSSPKHVSAIVRGAKAQTTSKPGRRALNRSRRIAKWAMRTKPEN